MNGRFDNKFIDEVLKKQFWGVHQAWEPTCIDSALTVPTENKEIWAQLPNQASKADLKLVQTQRALVKPAVAAAQGAYGL